MPRFTCLADWLGWQERLHPVGIDLGLERVRAVAERLGVLRPAPVVITVGGTNGKGSTVAVLDAVLRAAGYRVGAYLSPHLLRYNERVRLRGREVDDEALCAAFAAVDAARGEISLTYFEFGTLAALWLFVRSGLDVVVLEVGLGGRLDAVNVVDADAAIVTSIGIDHVEYLGPDRDSIGFEKAGIFRAGRPAICADPVPPGRLLAHAAAVGASLLQVGRDYGWARDANGWTWWGGGTCHADLPPPGLSGAHQFGNAAAALAALAALSARLPVAPGAIAEGISKPMINGRFQIDAGAVEWIFDVTHNPHGATALAAALRARPCAGRTLVLLGLLADKDAAGFAEALAVPVAVWCCAGLAGARGRSGEALAAAIGEAGGDAARLVAADVPAACAQLAAVAQPGDRVVVTGSFHTVAEALVARGVV
ncbi:dihydrofolate synthase/folylpolyglutamate synthase [Plasticicumulans lactativorans]|uniref:Dihydrofolate synthase/folylpolyglutamate synthase n=1 Tax=Plasticicumulans lactativorans TaxID=1133106 RepID=A0A4R2L2V1_9GAMM|nr:bifunctional tetrahydrofolate synthase/dihydrofolate synthase [Plasticicumulans lactativorans]TCO80814.1 dihydrofolate synthase/folylpolyglutamate synthase [Plasticicumulans lactativorans]